METPSQLITGICLLNALAVGAAAAAQAGINSTAGDALGHPMYGALTSFCGANLLLVCSNIILTLYRWSDTNNATLGAPEPLVFKRALYWFEYTGGLFGAVFVASAVFVSPIVGFALFFVGLVLG